MDKKSCFYCKKLTFAGFDYWCGLGHKPGNACKAYEDDTARRIRFDKKFVQCRKEQETTCLNGND